MFLSSVKDRLNDQNIKAPVWTRTLQGENQFTKIFHQELYASTNETGSNDRRVQTVRSSLESLDLRSEDSEPESALFELDNH